MLLNLFVSTVRVRNYCIHFKYLIHIFSNQSCTLIPVSLFILAVVVRSFLLLFLTSKVIYLFFVFFFLRTVDNVVIDIGKIVFGKKKNKKK